MTSPRILVFDLENTPGLGYFWGSTYDTSIIEVVEPSRVMCWGAKWRGDQKSKIQFRSTFHDGRQAMLEGIAELLDEADAVVSYNGDRHDTPHITTEFMREGITVPSPYREIDLYKVTKRRLKLHSNRLNFASQQFHIGQKVDHEGFPLWLKCMEGDEKAWAQMKRYQIGDVVLADDYCDFLLPLLPASMLPNHAVGADGLTCPRCESTKVQKRGFERRGLSMFQRFQCQGCGGWFKENKRVEAATVTAI